MRELWSRISGRDILPLLLVCRCRVTSIWLSVCSICSILVIWRKKSGHHSVSSTSILKKTPIVRTHTRWVSLSLRFNFLGPENRSPHLLRASTSDPSASLVPNPPLFSSRLPVVFSTLLIPELHLRSCRRRSETPPFPSTSQP